MPSQPAADQYYGFTKTQRLLTAKQFEYVFADAERRASHRHSLILARENSLGFPRLGLVIAKKHVRKAVARNRLKRLIRESFRQHQHQLPAIDAIVLARKGMDEFSKQDVLLMMNGLWQKIQRNSKR